MLLRPATALIALLTAAACAGSPEPAANRAGESAAAQRAAVAAGAESATCPSTEFEAFFSAYAEDTLLQRRWTRFPLEKLEVVPGADEPTEEVRLLARGDARFPLLPSSRARAADSLEVRIEEVDGGRRRVTIYKPDTDWIVHYVFAFDECWRLVRTEEWLL